MRTAALEREADQQPHTLIPSDRVEGTAVRRSSGEKVGEIKRVMIDKVSGKVAYAVMKFGGFLGMGEKYHPLPWDALKYNTALEGYELEEKSGKLTLFGTSAEEAEASVTYTGGYDLPDEAPPALKQATEMLIRQERARQQMQATSGIRSLSHRESRVQFFDPNAIAIAQSRGAGALNDPISALLMKYTRLEV